MRPVKGRLDRRTESSPTPAGSLLPGLGTLPDTSVSGLAMQILRHAQFAITMEIYTVVSSAATRDALKRLGSALDR
ncbi:hypothetical protein F8274_28865 [Micromonospora sp. AMSO31t]|nr:hypothetical protein F8274_28865 [Micromonospora sp. AMSO31t]